VVSIRHFGTHNHPRPPVVRATGAQLAENDAEAAAGTRVAAKKKASGPAAQAGPLMRTWTLYANGSGGLALRLAGSWRM
jgi:hypothetical protein